MTQFSRPCRLPWHMIVVFLCFVIGGPPAVFALQIDDPFAPMEGDISQTTSFVPAPREILRPLIRAKKAIREGQSRRAVELLGQILSEQQTDDYFVLVDSRTDLAVSMRNQASQLLGQLPAKDLEFYKLKFGVIARKQLEAAIATGDYHRIAQVARTYFYTDAGIQATILMGHHYLESGRAIAAAFAFQKVHDYAPARQQHDPSLSVMLATAWYLSEQSDRATAALVGLKKRQPSATIRFMGRELGQYQSGQAPMEWLGELIGSSTLAENRRVRQWLMYRGNSERNAVSQSGFPLPHARWVAPTLNDPDEEKIAIRQLDKYVANRASTIPAIHPLIVGDTVVTKSFQKTIGVDFATGKRMWVYPWPDVQVLRDDDEIIHDTLRASVNESPIGERMWQDSIYGQFSSDGQKLFVIPFPGHAAGEPLRMKLNKDVIVLDPQGQREYNELAALDLKQQGKLCWDVGGETGLDEPQLEGCLFQGPPLPLDGSLYAICHQKGEVRLVVLDAESGRLQWSQQLATFDPDRRDRRGPDRRLAGATPSHSNGILVCPTGIGALVAIDLASRSLLWGHQYQHPSNARSHRYSQYSTRSSISRLDQNWRDNSITIHGQTVVYSAFDSPSLVCVNLLTGLPLWSEVPRSKLAIDRGDSLYVAAIENNRICLVGLDLVRAIDLTTGQEAWSTSIADYGQPSGRGYNANGFYFLPTNKKQVIKFDIASGQVVDTVRTQRILGNLICYQGEIVSFGVDHLAVFPQDEPSLERVRIAETRGKMNAQLFGLKAQLLMHQDDLEGAARAAILAFEKTGSIRNRELMLDMLLALIGTDFEIGEELAKPYEQILLQARRRPYLMAKIDMLIRQEKFSQAADTMLAMLDQPSEFAVWSSELVPFVHVHAKSSESPKNDTHLVRMADWFKDRLSLVQRQISPEYFRLGMNTRVAQMNFADPVFRARLCDWLGPDAISSEFQLETAQQLTETLAFLHAEKVLNSLAESDSPANRQLAKRALATLYVNTAMFEQASLFLDKLRNQIATNNSNDKSTSIESSQFEKMSDIQNTIDQNWRQRIDVEFNGANTRMVPLHEEQGTMVRHQLRYLGQDPRFIKMGFRYYSTTGEIEIVDQDGFLIRRFKARHPSSTGRDNQRALSGRVRSAGNVLLVDIGYEVFAIDWFQIVNGGNPTLWYREVRQNPLPISPNKSVWGELAPASAQDLVQITQPQHGLTCLLHDNHLVCIDLLSGETVWKRRQITFDLKLFASHPHVAIWNVKSQAVEMFDLRTGSSVNQMELESQDVVRGMVSGSLLISSRRRLNAGKYVQSWSLLNCVRDMEVWSRRFPNLTRACWMNNRKITVLLPENQLEVIDPATGKSDFTTQLELPLSRGQFVYSVRVDQIAHGYLVKVHLGSRRLSRANVHDESKHDVSDLISVRKVEIYQRLWNGFVTVVDPTSGQTLWRQPSRIEYFQYLSDQPYSSPIIMLGRRVTRNDQPPSLRDTQQFIALDARNGKWLTTDTCYLRSLKNPKFQFDRDQRTLSLRFGDQLILLTLLNQTDRPPVPVANLIDTNTAQIMPPRPTRRVIDRSQYISDTKRLIERARADDQRFRLQRLREIKQSEKERRAIGRQKPVDPPRGPKK